MRQTFIVTYDICDKKRLRKVYRLMQGFGDHVQLSVFRCDLDEADLVVLRARLGDEIDCRVDQVLFIDIGPAEGRAATAVRAVGKAYVPPPGLALVV